MSRLSKFMRNQIRKPTTTVGNTAPLALAPSPFDPFVMEGLMPELGFFIEFMGIRTRLSHLPDECQIFSGEVFPLPQPGGRGFHDYAEWLGTVLSLNEAAGQFVGFELGAGWAPWSVAMIKGAERKAIKNCRVTAVEASRAHIGLIRQHLADNGVPESNIAIVNAAISGVDGTAQFPKMADPRLNYGAEIGKPVGAGDMETVKLMSLETLLGNERRIDLIHCDIQGAEADSFEAGIGVISDKVRRVVIGTHGRGIEEHLFQTFASAGWNLELEQGCQFTVVEGKPILTLDGCQVWKNPRI